MSYKLLCCLIILLWAACKFGDKEHYSENRLVVQSKEKTDTVSMLFQNEQKVIVKFDKNFFTVTQIKGVDSTSIVVPYAVDIDKRILCNECLFVRSPAGDTLVSGFYLSDSMFLLPILDFNKMILFGLDFPAKQRGQSDGRTDVYETTTLNAFIVYHKEKTIIVSDGLYYNDDGLINNVVSHVRHIVGTTVRDEMQFEIAIPLKLNMEVSDSIKDYLMEQLLKKKLKE